MMDGAEVLSQLDEQRRTATEVGSTLEVLPQVTRVAHGGGFHRIAFSALSLANAESVIDAQIAHYRALNEELEWTAYAHDTPSDLLSRLENRGFSIGPLEVVLILDLLAPPPWVFEQSAFRVEPITNESQLENFQVVSEQLFGTPPTRIVAEIREALAAGSSDTIGYLVFDGDAPIGAGRLHTATGNPFAGCYGGGTLASHRGRGAYRSGVAARARQAIALKKCFLRVDALPTSKPILERLGFVRITDTWPCVLAPTPH